MQIIIARDKTIFKKTVLYFGIFVALLVVSFIWIIPVHAAPVNSAFTDQNFYNCIIDRLNATNINGVSDRAYTYNATDGELAQITQLECSGFGKAANLKIIGTAGLEKLTALTSLELKNNQLTTIDVSQNTALTYLSLVINQLTAINLDYNTALTVLYLDYNQLTTIDASHNTALTRLYLSNNQLTTIDVSHSTALTTLYLDYNQLTTIDVSQNTALTFINLGSSQLTTIDVSHSTALTKLYLESNQLTAIDVSQNTALTYLNLKSNQLTNIDVSQNTTLTYLFLDPSVSKIETVIEPDKPSPSNPSPITKSSNNYLSTLSLSSGTISFVKDTLAYQIKVPYTVSDITTTATTEDSKSKVTVTGGTNLIVGDNTIIILVTAENGATKTYTITVARQAADVVLPNNSYLSNLEISKYSIKFDKETLQYTITINNEKTLNITATPEDPAAVATVIGNENLKSGSTVTIEVVAQDGTKKEYIINTKGNSSILLIILIIAGVLATGAAAFFVFRYLKNKKTAGDNSTPYKAPILGSGYIKPRFNSDSTITIKAPQPINTAPNVNPIKKPTETTSFNPTASINSPSSDYGNSSTTKSDITTPTNAQTSPTPVDNDDKKQDDGFSYFQ